MLTCASWLQAVVDTVVVDTVVVVTANAMEAGIGEAAGEGAVASPW